MQRYPTTAILLTCATCGLVRVADDYKSAHARGNAYVRLSGHPKIQDSQIEAPERITGALREAKASIEKMAQEAGWSLERAGRLHSQSPQLPPSIGSLAARARLQGLLDVNYFRGARLDCSDRTNGQIRAT